MSILKKKGIRARYIEIVESTILMYTQAGYQHVNQDEKKKGIFFMAVEHCQR